MQGFLDSLGQAVVTLGGRLLTVAAIFVVLAIIYVVTVALVRRLAARAARTPAAGEPDVSPADRALREATRLRRLDTVVLFTVRLERVLFVLFGVFAAFSILVPELIAGLGALGVALGAAIGAALGFGAQQLVRDYLNGILILGENPFSVGDWVALAGIRGTVEEVGIRRTVVRDNDGVVHSVPNGEILVASNFTRTFARVNERFAVAAGTDIERARTVLEEACVAFAAADGWSARFIEPPRVVRVDAAAPGMPGIPILASATVRPGEQWEVAGELRRRGIEALQVAGITLAGGQTVLLAREPLAGVAAAGEAEGGAEFT